MKLEPKELDRLVQKAEEIVSRIEKKDKIEESGKTQMSNAIDVVQSAKSFAVFKNWLRYQAVRQSSRDFWTLSSGNDTVCKRVANYAQTLSGEPDSEMAIERLILFLGFMRRALVAHKELKTIEPFLPGGKQT
jgi:hypothetical protein